MLREKGRPDPTQASAEKHTASRFYRRPAVLDFLPTTYVRGTGSAAGGGELGQRRGRGGTGGGGGGSDGRGGGGPRGVVTHGLLALGFALCFLCPADWVRRTNFFIGVLGCCH